jgi:hypothetical protein
MVRTMVALQVIRRNRHIDKKINLLYTLYICPSLFVYDLTLRLF